MRGRYIILLLSLLCCLAGGGHDVQMPEGETGTGVSVAESSLTATSCPKMSFALAGVTASLGSNANGTLRTHRIVTMFSPNINGQHSECRPKGRPRFMEVSPVSVHPHQTIIFFEKLLI